MQRDLLSLESQLVRWVIGWFFLIMGAMAHSIFVILKLLSLVFGVFLIITRVFLFEQTQGLIQSKIENLWIRIDDYHATALTKHLGFTKVVAGSLTSLLDRNFGPKLLSIQSLIVSVCYAVLTALTILIALLRFGGGYWEKNFLMFFVLYSGLGVAPMFFTLYGRAKQKKYLLIWKTFCLTSAWTFVGVPLWNLFDSVRSSTVSYVLPVLIIFVLSIVMALGLFAFFISIIRRSLRLIRDSNSLWKTTLISLLNLLPIFGVYCFIKLLSYRLDYSSFNPSLDMKDPAVLQSVLANWGNRFDMFLVLFLIALCLFCLVFLLTAVVFSFFSLIMFLHQLFWPMLSRLLYASQRFQVVNNGKILIYLGFIFILLGIGKLAWLETLLKILPR